MRGIPTVLTGFGLPDDAIHAPDEHLRFAHLETGTRAAMEILRALGEGQSAAWAAVQVGTMQRVLMERADMGRTETFAEVAFANPRPIGAIVEARITGAEGAQLRAA